MFVDMMGSVQCVVGQLRQGRYDECLARHRPAACRIRTCNL